MLKPGLTVIVLEGDDPGNGLPFLSKLLGGQADLGYNLRDIDKKIIVIAHHQYRDITVEELRLMRRMHPHICIVFVSTDRLIKRCDCMEDARYWVELSSHDSTGVRVIKQ